MVTYEGNYPKYLMDKEREVLHAEELAMETYLEEKREEKMKIYDTMYDYVQNGDISHYVSSGMGKIESEGKYRVFSFFPADDPDFWISDDVIEKNEKTYIQVHWGESEEEKHYLLEKALREKVWGIYEKGKNNDWYCTGIIYETKEDAERAMEKLF